MPSLKLVGLPSQVIDAAGDFFQDLLEGLGSDLVSMAVVGSAVTKDYIPDKSDINSVVILKDVKVAHLHAIAPLGRKYGKRGVAAPTILTPAYIETSRDVFALEFLNLRMAHKTVYGEDLLSTLEVKPEDLRLQVERNLKILLIRLRQGFIRSAGDARVLGEVIAAAASDAFPEIRGILHLLEKPVAFVRKEDLHAVGEASGIDVNSVSPILLDREASRLSLEEAESRFATLYEFLQALSEKADELLG
jgi:hypothetical protein